MSHLWLRGLNELTQSHPFYHSKEVQQINATGGSSSSSSNTGAIVGGAIAGVVVLGILAYLAFFLYRRRRTQLHRRGTNFGYADEIRPARRGETVVGGLAPGTYEPYTGTSSQNINASMSQLGQGAISTASPASRLNSDHNEISSPLLAGDSMYARSSEFATSGVGVLPVGAAAPGVGSGGFSPSHQSSNSRGSTYFRHREDVSDIGPSASQVGASSSVSGSGTGNRSGSTPGTFHIRNTSRASTGVTQPTSVTTANPPSSSVSQAILQKQAVANDELRAEVDNLRREMERLREERYTPPASTVGVPQDEAPPSYFQHEETRPAAIR